MKKLVSISLLFASLFLAPASHAFDLKTLLKGATQSSSDNNGSSTASTIGNLLGHLLSDDNIETNELVGTWNYSAPAVSFQSENFLQKAGGAAAATTIEEKLAPYYKISGVENLVLTIESDNTFTMKFKRVTLTGDITKSDDGNFIFNFSVAKKIKIGKMTTYITLAGNTMNIMFDVSKLASLLTKVGSISGNSTVQGVSTLLNSYDGICAGFKVTRQ